MQEINYTLTQLNFNWNLIEVIAVLFSIVYVILAAKENIWCWVAGIISVSCYIYICFITKLYAETGLQFFYLLISFYGLYSWNRKSQSLKISEWTLKKHVLILFLGIITTFLMGFFFSILSDAKMPIIDSFTTVFSILATYMVTKKVLENWLYWIIIDLVSVYMYFSRDLHLTSLLFLTYTIVAVFGYLRWLKHMNLNEKNNIDRS